MKLSNPLRHPFFVPRVEKPRAEGRFYLPDGRRLGFAEFGDPAGAVVLWFHGTPGATPVPAAVPACRRRIWFARSRRGAPRLGSLRRLRLHRDGRLGHRHDCGGQRAGRRAACCRRPVWRRPLCPGQRRGSAPGVSRGHRGGVGRNSPVGRPRRHRRRGHRSCPPLHPHPGGAGRRRRGPQVCALIALSCNDFVDPSRRLGSSPRGASEIAAHRGIRVFTWVGAPEIHPLFPFGRHAQSLRWSLAAPGSDKCLRTLTPAAYTAERLLGSP
ncbi:conserved hypothetical hydrolase [Mycobacterium marinum E11]|nr:conserved hypothetical hydrolase [Mycobacterium marinum E11]